MNKLTDMNLRLYFWKYFYADFILFDDYMKYYGEKFVRYYVFDHGMKSECHADINRNPFSPTEISL